MAAVVRNLYNRRGPLKQLQDGRASSAKIHTHRRSVLDFQELLQNLLATVRGATGALLIEADGEAVAWRSVKDPEQLRLRGAYVAVVLRACEASASELAIGTVDHLFVNYGGAAFLAHAVGGGYFLVVELDSSANLAEAIYRLKPFVNTISNDL
jgi:predicted regulator of Ras-like GTPase activity (Roadblock/LC7/MglB family)